MHANLARIARFAFCPLLLTLVSSPAMGEESPYHRTGGTLTPAMKYFGGVVRVAAAPRTRPTAMNETPQDGKPFENLTRPQTISPYLALDRIESGVSLPNYHAFVRPQMEQQQAMERQSAQLRRMRHRLNSSGATDRRQSTLVGNVPTTGNSRQFLNTGGFFPGPR